VAELSRLVSRAGAAVVDDGTAGVTCGRLELNGPGTANIIN